MKRIIILLCLCLLLNWANAQTNPSTYIVKSERLLSIKEKIKAGDKTANGWLKTIIKQANEQLSETPGSVMLKNQTPPSGSKHDYMSMAPYFWPDSSKPGYVPYMRKDGERNPEVHKITDHKELDKLEKAVQILSLAYYFSGDEKYAVKAANFLHVWFLDSATKMNPNLQYAQAIKGVNDGRGTGLIETIGFINVENAVGLLVGSKGWTKADDLSLKEWFSTFLTWMLNSNNGKHEHDAKNNHGIWYDAQVVSLQLYLGKVSEAKEYITNNTLKRIPVQIEADGKMPLELVRTAAMSYNNFCLEAWFKTATLADKAGIDIWHYSTADGKNIRLAFEWFLPYAMGEKKWEYKQIHDYKRNKLYYLLLLASNHYNEPKYYEAAQKIKKEAGNTIIDLFYDK